ncbi:LPP20 family lipoprotein [bacterium]|nr:LPP20 family lipoprotein [bacterium]
MKKITIFMSIAIILTIMSSCGSAPTTKVTPYGELTKVANGMRKNGAITAVGQGQSKREDIARDKSHTDARAKMSQAMEAKVSTLNKSFQEEIGTGDETEINEAFTDVVKIVSKSVLKGAFPEDERMLEKDGTITVYTLMVIDPATFNQSFLDEMKSQPKLYERFRASQAYDELQEEMTDFEQK